MDSDSDSAKILVDATCGCGGQPHKVVSQKLNGGVREWASQVLDHQFKICNLVPKSALFLPKAALEPAENGQMKGNSGYSTHAARLPRTQWVQLKNAPPKSAVRTLTVPAPGVAWTQALLGHELTMGVSLQNHSGIPSAVLTWPKGMGVTGCCLDGGGGGGWWSDMPPASRRETGSQ